MIMEKALKTEQVFGKILIIELFGANFRRGAKKMAKLRRQLVFAADLLYNFSVILS